MKKAIAYQLIANQIHPKVVEWVDRVRKNGGGEVSSRTVTAVNRFYVGLVKNNLLQRIGGCNCFVPDSLIAALTPLIKGGGYDPWTNYGFISSDLTINGLKGGGTRYLNSGIIPGSCMDETSGHLCVYISQGVAETAGLFACAEYSTSNTRLYSNYVIPTSSNRIGYTAFDDYTDILVIQSSPWQGYFIGTRWNSGLGGGVVFIANSSTPHTLAGSTNYWEGNVPQETRLTVFATNEGGIIYYRSSKRFSFASAGGKMVENDSKQYFALIHAMRQEIGRGYI